MSFSPSDIRIGPCNVTLNGVDLGGTMEGVKVKIAPKTADLKIDQLGDVPVDSVMTGFECSVEMTLAASANKDNWKIAIPYGKLITSGPNKAFYVDNRVGTQLSQYAVPLIIHPQGVTGVAEDFNFFKAVVKSAIELDYDATKQRGLKLTLDILPDFTKTPAAYFTMGDPALGLVAAAAAAPSAGENTGDGTCGSQSAGTKTLTETITITCIGTNGSNKSAWKVVGSVSGPIGTVELTGGVGGTGVFTSDYVNFALTDASTDFVVGDEFTIATTAANYV